MYLGDDFRLVSVFCVALGSTADTCGASVYEAFLKNFSHFYLKRWIADPEVDSRLSVLPVFSEVVEVPVVVQRQVPQFLQLLFFFGR